MNNGLKNDDPLGFLYSVRELSSFLQTQGLRMSRALGQNFLIDRNIINQMLEAADLPHEGNILEIGPGLGHLTWMLLQRGYSVTAVEKDRTFVRILDELSFLNPNFRNRLNVVPSDALSVDFFDLAQAHSIRYVIGNLPYNVAIPILFHIVYSQYPFAALYSTVQKEVGERILAAPETKDYGRLSVTLQYLFEVKKIRYIPPTAFYPRPKVESIFLKFNPRPEAQIEFARKFLERILQIGFAHRRKKIRGQLQGAIVERRVLDESSMKQLENEFNLDQRAEAWNVETWIRMAEWVSHQSPRK